MWLQERKKLHTYTQLLWLQLCCVCIQLFLSQCLHSKRSKSLPSQLFPSLKIAAVKVKADSSQAVTIIIIIKIKPHNKPTGIHLKKFQLQPSINTAWFSRASQQDCRPYLSHVEHSLAGVCQNKPTQVQSSLKCWGSGASYCSTISMSVLLEDLPRPARKPAVLLLMPSDNCPQKRLLNTA